MAMATADKSLRVMYELLRQLKQGETFARAAEDRALDLPDGAGIECVQILAEASARSCSSARKFVEDFLAAIDLSIAVGDRAAINSCRSH